jgi:hypothetical protein
MSKTGNGPEMRPLVLIHSLAICILGAGWGYYCWVMLHGRSVRLTGGFRSLEAAFDSMSAAAADVLLGLCTLLIFAIGTGIYVRRVQVWLDARSAGQGVAYGSADLKDQALAANAKRAARS